MSLTVVAGIICLLAMLWLVMHQPRDGDEMNVVLIIVLAISFPLMICGGMMDMEDVEAVESAALETHSISNV